MSLVNRHRKSVFFLLKEKDGIIFNDQNDLMILVVPDIHNEFFLNLTLAFTLTLKL